METTNQDRKKHHSGEDNSDEDYYSYDDNYSRPNQMCCPYMNNCECMNQHMNYKSFKMNRGQDDQIDNDSNYNDRDSRYPGFGSLALGLGLGLGLGYPGYGYGYGYPGYGYGYPDYGYGYGYSYPDYGYGWGHNWHGNNGWNRNNESQV